MGLDIGIIKITYLDRPRGWAYRFAWEMAVEASANGYMHGEGNNWGPFTKEQVREMLEEFARDKGLTTSEKNKLWRWVNSLPWEGRYIELHFSW